MQFAQKTAQPTATKSKSFNLEEALEKDRTNKREETAALAAEAAKAAAIEKASPASAPTTTDDVPIPEEKGHGTPATTTSDSDVDKVTMTKEKSDEIAASKKPAVKRISLAEYAKKSRKILEAKKPAVESSPAITESTKKAPLPQKKTESHAPLSTTKTSPAQIPLEPRMMIGHNEPWRDPRLVDSAGKKRRREEYQTALTLARVISRNAPQRNSCSPDSAGAGSAQAPLPPAKAVSSYAPQRDPRLVTKSQRALDTTATAPSPSALTPTKKNGHHAPQRDVPSAGSASKKRGREVEAGVQTQAPTSSKRQKVAHEAAPGPKKVTPAKPAPLATPAVSASKKRFREEEEVNMTKEKGVTPGKKGSREETETNGKEEERLTSKRPKLAQDSPNSTKTPASNSSNARHSTESVESESASSSSGSGNSRRATNVGPGTKSKGGTQGMRGVAQAKTKPKSRKRNKEMDDFIV